MITAVDKKGPSNPATIPKPALGPKITKYSYREKQ
jgi:hypothetical protein